MWFIAIGAGVFETVLVTVGDRAGDNAIVGVSIRAAVFVAAFAVVSRMFSGRRWARLVLASALGVLGTLSMTVDPLRWLVHGNSLADVIRRSGLVDLLFGGSRVIHVIAVLAACVCMFVPSANGYFRAGASVGVRGDADAQRDRCDPAADRRAHTHLR